MSHPAVAVGAIQELSVQYRRLYWLKP